MVADGKVTHPPSKRSFTFGELTKGKKLTKIIGLDTLVPPPAPSWTQGRSTEPTELPAVGPLQGQRPVRCSTHGIAFAGSIDGQGGRPATSESSRWAIA